MKFLNLCVLFSLALLLLTCSNKQKQLTGRWQKVNDSGITIEFTESGQYYLEIQEEKLLQQPYDYWPDSARNNLQIGKDTARIIGHVQFLEDNKISITTTRPASKNALEYQRVE